MLIMALSLLMTTSFIVKGNDELYPLYVRAVENSSTFQYYLVITVKNMKTGKTREICTEGNFLQGALHIEYNIDYSKEGQEKIMRMAIDNKNRYFEFKNKKALANIGVNDYSPNDLKKLEKKINFDSLAAEIKKSDKWQERLNNDIKIAMWAHELFNRGILTGQNSCWGGAIQYVANR